MVRNMIPLVHDRCLWPRTHPWCPVTHQNVSSVLGKALKIFATIVTLKTIVHPWKSLGGVTRIGHEEEQGQGYNWRTMSHFTNLNKKA